MIRFALLALTIATPASAQTALPQGDWMGFPVTAIGAGLIVPVYEHLSIDGDRAVQIAWTYPVTDRGCTGTVADPPACTPPVQVGAVRLSPLKGGFGVQPEGAQVGPYTHPTDTGFWPDIALAGHDWRMRGDDRRMILSREAEIEGEPLTLERFYLRAEPDVPGLLFDYLFVREASLGQAICGIDALHGDPLRWRGFVDDLRLMAPVLAEIRQTRLQAVPSAEAQRRVMTLITGPEALGTDAADVGDLPQTARAAVLALRLGQHGDEVAGPRLVTLDWPAPPDMVEAEGNCLAYHFDY